MRGVSYSRFYNRIIAFGWKMLVMLRISMCFDNVDVCALYLLLVKFLWHIFVIRQYDWTYDPRPNAHSLSGYESMALEYGVARSLLVSRGHRCAIITPDQKPTIQVGMYHAIIQCHEDMKWVARSLLVPRVYPCTWTFPKRWFQW